MGKKSSKSKAKRAARFPNSPAKPETSQPKRDFDILKRPTAGVPVSSPIRNAGRGTSNSGSSKPIQFHFVPKDLDEQVLLAIEAAAVLVKNNPLTVEDLPEESSSAGAETEAPEGPSAEMISTEQAHRLFGLEQACCVVNSKSSKHHPNCHKNPNCLLGLFDRTTGLWDDKLLKQNQHSAEQEDTLSLTLREKKPFLGLRNLGATCYLNSLLQCLFMEEEFRRGVYNWHSATPDDESVAPCHELQSLFTRLQLESAASVDPERFVKLLEIPTGVQQDATEFNNLLLSFLEKRFKNSPEKDLIPKLFGGKVAYLIRCCQCQNVTERIQDFREVNLRVQGHANIESSLREYTLHEELTGSNQYRCECCDSLQDAVRWTEFRELPDCLNVTLKRFDYQLVDGDFSLQKVKDLFNFPLILDLETMLSPENVANLIPHCFENISNPSTVTTASTPSSTTATTPTTTSSSSSSSSSSNLHPTTIIASSASSAPTNHPTSPPTATTLPSATPLAPVADDSPVVQAPAEASPLKFQLKAVLVHIGESATAGHYYAFVKDLRTQQWWKFDDRSVTKATEADICEVPVVLHQPPVKANQRRRGGYIPPPAPPKSKVPPGTISSGNAYMLVYSRVSRRLPASPPQPSDRLRAHIDQENQQLLERMVQQAEEEAKLRQLAQEHRARYQAFLEIAPLPPSSSAPFRLLSKNWLRKWGAGDFLLSDSFHTNVSKHPIASSSSSSSSSTPFPFSSSSSSSNDQSTTTFSPGPSSNINDNDINVLARENLFPIDNSDLLCPHQLADPSKVGITCRISVPAWESLYLEYGGGPVLTEHDLCHLCALKLGQEQRAQRTYDAHKQRILTTLSKVRNEPGFWVSRDWMDEWKMVYSPASADLSLDMTEGMLCPHQSLLPARACARLIPQSCFRILRAYFPLGPELPEAAEPCGLCGDEAAILASQRAERQRQRNAERNALLSLYTRSKAIKQETPPPGRYFMVPLAWLHQWREYLDDLNIEAPPPPLPLEQFFCPHGLCIYNINNPEDDYCSRWLLVEPNDFQRLVDKYHFTGQPLQHVVTSNGHGKPPSSNTEPPCCLPCAQDRLKADLLNDCSYQAGDIWISRSAAAENWPRCSSNPLLAELLSTVTSFRHARQITVDRIKLILNSFDSILNLKLKVFERMSIPVYKMAIYCRAGCTNASVHDKADQAILETATPEPAPLLAVLTKRLETADQLAATLPLEPEPNLDQFQFGVSLRESIQKATELKARLALYASLPEEELATVLVEVKRIIQEELTFDPDQITVAFWRIRKGDTLRIVQTAAPTSTSTANPNNPKSTRYDAFTKTKLGHDITPDRLVDS